MIASALPAWLMMLVSKDKAERRCAVCGTEMQQHDVSGQWYCYICDRYDDADQED